MDSQRYANFMDNDRSGEQIHQPPMHSADEMHDEREWSRVTLACIGDGVITTDMDGAVTFLNAVAQELTGWTMDQANGVKLTDAFHIVNEDTRRKVENPALHALKNGVIVGLANHTILIARDGREFPIDDSASPIRNSRGDVIGVVLVFRDVTERRATERALRSSEVRYRRLFQSAKDGILILRCRVGKSDRCKWILLRLGRVRSKRNYGEAIG